MTDSTSGNDDRGIGEFASGIIHDAAGMKDSLTDSLSIDIHGMKAAGGTCHKAACETSTICDTTISKARQLIDFGVEMKTALEVFNDGIDASDIVAVARVVNSDRMSAALGLASEMDDLALACVNQSIKMIDSIDAGIETLPDILEKEIDKRMDRAKEKGSKEGDPELPNLQPDVRELEETVGAVRDVNPLTAVDSLQRAFTGIASKGERCKDMFSTIHDFAKDVAGISETIESFKLGKMAGHIKDFVKDIWRSLRLSDLIRSFAVAVGQLIKWIIKVMQAVMEKIKIIGVYIGNSGCCLAFETKVLKGCGVDLNDILKLGRQLLSVLASGAQPNTNAQPSTSAQASSTSTGKLGVVA